MIALLWGLGAAIAWGIADYVAALTARRRGTFNTLLGMQAISLVVFALFAALLGELPPLTGASLVAALAMGVLEAVSLAALYRGLAFGPIAIVSPIVAAYAAVTVILSVFLLSETLSPLQVAAVGATIAGVALASTDLRLLRETLGRPSSGPALAIGAMFGFGILGFLFATYARQFGTLGMVTLLRGGTMPFLLTFAALRRLDLSGLGGRALGPIALIAVLGTGGNVLFGYGANAGYASLVATGSTAYPLIPFALGLSVLRERPAPNQFVGVALLVAGVLTLAAVSR